MTREYAQRLFKPKTRKDALNELLKKTDFPDVFDKEMESAYEMAAEALEYDYIPVEGVTFGGNQVYYRV